MATSTDALRLRARGALSALSLGAFVSAFSGCDPDPRQDPGCPSGSINCPCLPDGTCEENEGECIDDLCVDTDIDEPIPPQKVEGASQGGALQRPTTLPAARPGAPADH